MRNLNLLFPVFCFSCLSAIQAFLPGVQQQRGRVTALLSSNNDGAWDGQVVASSDGRIRGCKIQPAKEDSLIDWVLTIDGEEADLGRFSEAIYKKIMQDAKQQRFQGFRPGTIPPHLEPTYRAFAMDECARETVLEALQQNSIRPFESTRSEMFLKDFQIPPPKPKKNKKKKKGASENDKEGEEAPAEPSWRSFETMKEAINAGWKPGQSFSFVAVDVKGQKVKSDSDVTGSRPLGLTY